MIITYIITIFLVLLSGLFSGLTLGLLSLDRSELKRKISLGNEDAKKVFAVRKQGNLLLCTLLLGNVAVNSAIAILLGNIASGFVAGLIATGLIVIFGEIIPQATISRYALQVGAKTAWLVKLFMIVLSPVCYPIALILDKTLGEEMPSVYSKKELMKIVEEHEDSAVSTLDADEERIIKGALSYSDKSAKDVLTPRTVVYGLAEETILTNEVLDDVKDQGFTRIPVYKDSVDNPQGVLYAKDLINIAQDTPVKDVYKKDKVLFISENIKLDELMSKFIRSKTHFAFVEDEYGGLEGVVTLEDVIEEIIKQEIVDETDKVEDMQKVAKGE